MTNAHRAGHPQEGSRFQAVQWLDAAPIVALQLAMAGVFLANRSPGTGAAWTSLPLDDSWIHLVYARSLAAFEGFAYNPGQLEAGFTSPLWTLLLAPVFWVAPILGADPIPFVKMLGLLIGTGCSLLAVAFVTRLTGRRALGIAAGLLIASEPTFAFAALSGMEVVLAAATLLLCLLAIAQRRLRLAGVALALVPLARPENALFVLLAAPVLVGCLREMRASRWTWIATAAPCIVAGAVWIGYCLAVTGRPLPSTFYVKSLESAGVPWLGVIAGNVASIVGILRALPVAGLGLGAIAALIGVRELWRTARSSDGTARGAAALLAALYPFVFLAGVALTHQLGDPHYFYWSRYVHPIIPLLIVQYVVGLAALVDRAAAGWRPAAAGRQPPSDVLSRHWRCAAAALALACALPPVLLTPGSASVQAETYAWNSQNMQEVQVAVARWLRAHTAPDVVVASVDAGAVRYYADRITLDLAGLNSHTLLSGRRATLSRMVPRYLVAFEETPDRQLASRLGLVERFRATSRHYTVAPAREQASLAVYEVTRPEGLRDG